MDRSHRELRRAFRYFKRGVFPPESVDDFTFGREAEIAAIERCLQDVKDGSSRHAFVEGTYGRGKSHLLKAVEAIALKKRFAVSWVTLDGYNHAFNHPTRYFHAFLENVREQRFPVRGMASLVRCWLGTPLAESILTWAQQSAPWWLRRPILSKLTVDESSYWESSNNQAMIESRDLQHVYGKQWFGTISDRMSHTAELCCVAGLKGIVYLFDELETVVTLLSNIRQRFLSYEFLNLLIDGRRHPHCFFMFAMTPDFGIKVSADHEYQFQYSEDYPEACRFVQKWVESSVDVITLRRLTRADILNVCRQLRAWHEVAFSWKTNGRLSNAFLEAFVSKGERFNLGLRETIKALVDLLEIGHQHPQVNVRAALN